MQVKYESLNGILHIDQQAGDCFTLFCPGAFMSSTCFPQRPNAESEGGRCNSRRLNNKKSARLGNLHDDIMPTGQLLLLSTTTSCQMWLPLAIIQDLLGQTAFYMSPYKSIYPWYTHATGEYGFQDKICVNYWVGPDILVNCARNYEHQSYSCCRFPYRPQKFENWEVEKFEI